MMMMVPALLAVTVCKPLDPDRTLLPGPVKVSVLMAVAVPVPPDVKVAEVQAPTAESQH